MNVKGGGGCPVVLFLIFFHLYTFTVVEVSLSASHPCAAAEERTALTVNRDGLPVSEGLPIRRGPEDRIRTEHNWATCGFQLTFDSKSSAFEATNHRSQRSVTVESFVTVR